LVKISLNYETSRATSTTRADRRRRRRRRDLPKSHDRRVLVVHRARTPSENDRSIRRIYLLRLPSSPLSRARERARHPRPIRRRRMRWKKKDLQSSSFSRSRARASVTARLAPDEFAQENFLVRIERLRGSKTRERGRRQSRVASIFFDWKNARKTPPERWTRELHPAAIRDESETHVDDQR